MEQQQQHHVDAPVKKKARKDGNDAAAGQTNGVTTKTNAKTTGRRITRAGEFCPFSFGHSLGRGGNRPAMKWRNARGKILEG